MAYADKVLQCRDCGSEFVFTEGEQEFYAEKGFAHEPGRCPSCRAQRKQSDGRTGGNTRSNREWFRTTCSRCGGPAEVPFKPSGDRPVYCSECYQPAEKRY
ncbi:MAG: zinc-ribbon domain containing protein [Bacillota bacterium]